MDKRDLKGSPSRDAFKHWHKTGPKDAQGMDMDFAFTEKVPPGVVALTDYKRDIERDRITFAEVIAYNFFLSLGIPVYIIESECLERFNVYRYLGGDWRPYPDPTWKKECVLRNGTATDYWRWEMALRAAWRKGASS